MTQGKTNVQPDRDSNPGPFAFKANALPTEVYAACTSPQLLTTLKSEVI